MGSLYSKDVIRTAIDEIGYQGGKKTSKYSKALDAVNYWQMGKKDGSADWCSIFVNYCIYMSTRNADGDIDPDKWDAHYFTFEPDKGENLAAGCGYAADYYMQNDAWDGSSQGARVGDQVFFRNFAHSGLVIDWDDKGIYTVEGNVDGNKVEKRFYSYSECDSVVDGFGHPRYDGDEYPTGNHDEKPEPDPEPDPAPSPDRYEATTNGGVLRVRSAPNTSSAYLIGIPNGKEIGITDIVEGEEIGHDTRWGRTCYEGYNGYVSMHWVTKI